MKLTSIRIIVFGLLILGATACLAQDGGGGGGTGGGGNSSGGGTGGGGSSGGSGSNSSGSGSSSSVDTGVNNETTAVTGTTDTPTFQGFEEGIGSRTFIGVPNTQTFIGQTQTFDASTSTSSKRTTTSSASRRTTSSRATTSRMSSSRSNMGRTSGTTSGGRQVRSSTSPDFQYTPTTGSYQASQFQSRLTHLPNLRDIPQRVEYQWTNTPDGTTVAKMTGTVASSKDKKLAEMLLRLEPGVDRVQNDLVVKP